MIGGIVLRLSPVAQDIVLVGGSDPYAVDPEIADTAAGISRPDDGMIVGRIGGNANVSFQEQGTEICDNVIIST